MWLDVKRLAAILGGLPSTLPSDHFIVHYGLRNPKQGPGMGAGGVRDVAFVKHYRDNLEAAYGTLTGPRMRRKPPPVGIEGKTLVYVFNILELTREGSPFTYIDRQGIPYIALPCRNADPTLDAERQRAAAEAIHETTHVFNCLERPLGETSSEPWFWFDEATAVFMENYVTGSNVDYLRYATDWTDMPEISLDSEMAIYQAGMFARYLAERTEPGFISNVWMQVHLAEGPIETLTRLLNKRRMVLTSPDPGVQDVFASGYCMDSYFARPPHSMDFARDAHTRCGYRSISESFVLNVGETESRKGMLDHLACRYYIIYTAGRPGSLRVEIDTSTNNGTSPLKAEIAVVTSDHRRSATISFQRTDFPGQPATTHLGTEIDMNRLDEADHFVLVVTNCGTQAAPITPGSPHDDDQEYRLTIATT